MCKWPLRTDILSCWKPLTFFLLYLLFLSLNKNLATTTVGWFSNEPRALNSCYIYLQFIVCIMVVTITVDVFEETFRHSSYEFFRTFPVGTAKIILVRYFRLIFILLIPYIPTVAIMFNNANMSIQNYLVMFPDIGPFPLVNPFTPLLHCVISINFYVLATMFLFLLFKSKVLVLVLIMAYCALEATMLHFMFPQYVIFRGAFNTPDFYHWFPSNIVILAITSVIMLGSILILYSPRQQTPTF